MLKDFCDQAAIDELDRCLSNIQRFPELKIFKEGLKNIKQFTADEYCNMKVFLFIVEGLIKKHHKASIEANVAKHYDNILVNIYYQ